MLFLTNMFYYGILTAQNLNAEEYRSGHNEPVSKTGAPQGAEGSNPSSSAITKNMVEFL